MPFHCPAQKGIVRASFSGFCESRASAIDDENGISSLVFLYLVSEIESLSLWFVCFWLLRFAVFIAATVGCAG